MTEHSDGAASRLRTWYDADVRNTVPRDTGTSRRRTRSGPQLIIETDPEEDAKDKETYHELWMVPVHQDGGTVGEIYVHPYKRKDKVIDAFLHQHDLGRLSLEGQAFMRQLKTLNDMNLAAALKLYGITASSFVNRTENGVSDFATVDLTASDKYTIHNDITSKCSKTYNLPFYIADGTWTIRRANYLLDHMYPRGDDGEPTNGDAARISAHLWSMLLFAWMITTDEISFSDYLLRRLGVDASYAAEQDASILQDVLASAMSTDRVATEETEPLPVVETVTHGVVQLAYQVARQFEKAQRFKVLDQYFFKTMPTPGTFIINTGYAGPLVTQFQMDSTMILTKGEITSQGKVFVNVFVERLARISENFNELAHGLESAASKGLNRRYFTESLMSSKYYPLEEVVVDHFTRPLTTRAYQQGKKLLSHFKTNASVVASGIYGEPEFIDISPQLIDTLGSNSIEVRFTHSTKHEFNEFFGYYLEAMEHSEEASMRHMLTSTVAAQVTYHFANAMIGLWVISMGVAGFQVIEHCTKQLKLLLPTLPYKDAIDRIKQEQEANAAISFLFAVPTINMFVIALAVTVVAYVVEGIVNAVTDSVFDFKSVLAPVQEEHPDNDRRLTLNGRVESLPEQDFKSAQELADFMVTYQDLSLDIGSVVRDKLVEHHHGGPDPGSVVAISSVASSAASPTIRVEDVVGALNAKMLTYADADAAEYDMDSSTRCLELLLSTSLSQHPRTRQVDVGTPPCALRMVVRSSMHMEVYSTVYTP